MGCWLAVVITSSRTIRHYLCTQIVRAVDAAIMDPDFPRRMQIKFLIPESNPAFDSYRIGTVLEMVSH